VKFHKLLYSYLYKHICTSYDTVPTCSSRRGPDSFSVSLSWLLDFSWKTKQLSRAQHCSGVKSLNTPLNSSSVTSSSSALYVVYTETHTSIETNQCSSTSNYTVPYKLWNVQNDFNFITAAVAQWLKWYTLAQQSKVKMKVWFTWGPLFNADLLLQQPSVRCQFALLDCRYGASALCGVCSLPSH